jgi:nucleotide-binding universal stress UspA family protein
MNGQRDVIVVGVDGSESSKTALRWALHQARLELADVEAVTAWQDPGWAGYPPPIARYSFEEAAERTVAATIAEVRKEADAEHIQVHTHVLEGNAARVLIDASRGARMLVVGNRGHGGFTEALLGSVSQHCTHHAQCPVVVIRGE